MNINNLIATIALQVNRELYEENKITYHQYKLTEKQIINKYLRK